MKRVVARVFAVVGALSVSCNTANAGVFNSLFNSGLPIPVPGIGIPGIRVSSGSRGLSPQQQQRNAAIRAYNEAIDLSHANRLQESRQKFEQAIQIDPSFELAWAALPGSCMNSGALEEGISAGNEYASRFPNGSRRHDVELVVQKMQEQLSAKKEIYSRVGPDGADSYFALATEGKNFYGWNLNEMPLKVYIGDGRGVHGYHPNDATILNNSFAEWTLATEDHITFTRTQNADEANIECIWIDDPKDFPENGGLEAGEAVPRLDSRGYIVHSKLYLLTRRRQDGKTVDDMVMHSVCLHEIGHTLGLLGHSDNPSDVMYFTAHRQTVQEPHLTQRDVNTLAKLYAKVLDTRTANGGSSMPASSLLASSSASNTVPASESVTAPMAAQAPIAQQAMNASTGADLGEPGKQQSYSNGASFRDNQLAISYFEKAVAAHPNDPKVLDDLGTAYSNYGIELANKNDMKQAEKYFNLAYSIHRNSTDRSKLRNTVANLMQLLHYENRDNEAARMEANLQSSDRFGN